MRYGNNEIRITAKLFAKLKTFFCFLFFFFIRHILWRIHIEWPLKQFTSRSICYFLVFLDFAYNWKCPYDVWNKEIRKSLHNYLLRYKHTTRMTKRLDNFHAPKPFETFEFLEKNKKMYIITTNLVFIFFFLFYLKLYTFIAYIRIICQWLGTL